MKAMASPVEQAQLESKLIDMAFRKINISVIAALLLATLIVVALWSLIEHARLLTWLGAIAAVMALHVISVRRYLRLENDTPAISAKWKTAFIAGSAAAGLCWSSTVFYFPSSPFDSLTIFGGLVLPSTPFDPVIVLLIFILAGVTAYQSVAMASAPSATIAFLICVWMPQVVWLVSLGEQLYVVMGLIALTYLGGMVMVSRRMHATICSLFLSAEKNQELAVALARAEQVEFAKAQKENDRRNSELFASFEDLIFLVDVAEEGGFTIASINPAAERAFGFKNAEVHGKRKADLFPAALAARLEAYDQACVDSGQTVHYEEMLEQPSGNHYFSVTHIPIFDASGKVIRIAAITRDVTERKQSEERLLKSEAQFRRLAENAPDPIYRYDRDCRRIYINPAVERLTGTPAAELLNKSPIEAMPVPSVNALYAQQSIQRVLDTGKPGELEITFTAQDGQERTVLNTLVPEFAADGSVETVLCVGRDMSARKRMEKILLDSEREYRTLSENLPGNVIRYDRDCRVRFMNKNVEEVLGIPAAYVLGKTPSEVFTDGMFDELELVLQGVMEKGQAVDYDIILPDSGKGERYHRMTLTPEKNERGEVIGVLNIGSDITEQKRYEQELLARAKLEQRLSSYLNSAPGFFFSLCQTPDGQISMPFASEGIKAIYGLEPQDVAESVVAIIERDHPDDLSKKFAAMEKSGRTLLACQVEFRVLNKELGERWVEARSLPQRNADGTIHWHGFMHDITERKAADSQLKLLNYALDHVNEEVFLVEENADLSYVNSAACRGRDYTREELLKQNITVLDPNFPMERWSQHWQELKENGSLYFETLHTRKDGQVFPVEIRANYFEFDGKGYNLSLVHDITERLAIENALKASEKMLQEAQRIAHVGSWDVDMVNDRLVWSDEIFRIWEIDKTQFNATFAAFLASVHPEDREHVTQAYNAAIDNHSLYEVEHRLLFPDGRVKHILERGEPQFDAQGKPVRFIGTSLDITERKRMEATLLASEERHRTVFESANDGIFLHRIIERDGNIEFMLHDLNQKGCELWGHSREDILSGNFDLLVMNNPPYSFEEATRRNLLAAAGEPQLFDWQLKRGDGSKLWGEVNLRRIQIGEESFLLSVMRDVNERKHMEALLQKRESEFRSLSENSPDIIARYDHECRRLYVNQAMAVLAGKPSDALIGMSPGDGVMLAPEYADKLIAGIREVFANGKSKRIDLTVYRDGNTHEFDTLLAPEFGTDGEVATVLLLSRDITDRKNAQRRIELLDYAIDQSSDAIFLVDEEFRFAYVSAGACRSLGYSAEELLTMGTIDIDPNVTREMLIEMKKSTSAAEGLQSLIESCHRTRDGRIFPVEVAATVVYIGDVKYILTVVRDITERKRVEEKLALRELEFRTLAENSPDPIYRYDRDCRRLYVNSAVGKIMGKPVEELIGSTPADSAILVSEESLRLMEAIRRVFDSGEAENMVLDFVASDGEHRDYFMSLVPERNVAGQVMTVLALARDVTVIRGLERMQSQFFAMAPGIFATLVHRTDGSYVMPFVSDGVRDLYDLEPEAVMRDIGVLGARVHPDDVEMTSLKIKESERELTHYHDEYRIIHPGKGLRWIECNSMPQRQPDGGTRWDGFYHDITERKRMESALRDQADFQGTLLSALSDANVQLMMIENGRVIFIGNRELARGFGYTDAEIDAHPALLDFIHPDDKAGVMENYQRRLAGENIHSNYEMGLITKDGERREFDVAIAVVPDTNPVRIVTIGRDVTERKQMEAELIAREQEFRALVEQAPEPIIRYAPDGRRIYVNAAVERITGIPVSELLDELAASGQIISTRQGTAVTELVRRICETGEPSEFEVENVGGDGRLRYFHMRFAPEFGADGKVRSVLSICHDITERKQMEVEIRASEAQLRVRSELLHAVLESSPDMITFALDQSHRYIAFNSKHKNTMQAIWGKDIVLGMNMLEVIGDHSDHNAAKICFDRALAGECFTLEEAYGEEGLSRQYWQNHYAPMYSEEGALVGMTCFVLNITERHKMELAREFALSEALRLAQLRSAFLAQMSHELRTPLNGILGYAQNLLQGEALVEKQVDGLRIIQHSGEHLLLLINGILDHAAIEADKFELIPGDIELEPFLATIIGIIRVRAEQKNITFACEADAGLSAVVRGDAQRLRQVLLNLLSNAVKFTDNGQVTLRLNCATPTRLLFAVQDSGVGIDAEQMENIFLPFEQVGETSRRAGGTGLGLAISRKLVMLMGGDIKVKSQPGAGSTFSFEVEMEAIQPGAATVNVAALSEQALTRASQAKPLLHVPPRQELNLLHALALRGNMRDVIKHADKLAELDEGYLPFADHLRQLAKSFQTKALVSLIEQYRDGGKGRELWGHSREDILSKRRPAVICLPLRVNRSYSIGS